MDKWQGKVAIVTGASAGIGEAITRALVHHGMVVVGLARRQEKVEALAEELSKAKEPGQLHAVKADLSKEEDILKAFQWVETKLGGADVLVNNAGLAKMGYLKDGKTEDWRTMFDLNVIAVGICTREYLKSMEKHNNQLGHILVINSVRGHSCTAMTGMYSASKFAARALTMSLRRELAERSSTIKVTDVSPGLTRSELTAPSIERATAEGNSVLDGEDVAEAVVGALSASPVTQICEVVLAPVPNKAVLY